MPPNVERWKTSAPSVARACDITLSICSTGITRIRQPKLKIETKFQRKIKELFEKQDIEFTKKIDSFKNII